MKRETTLFIVAMVTLTATGMLMVFSIGAAPTGDDMLFFRHLIYVAVGFAGFLIMSRFDYHHLGNPVLLRYIVWGSLLLLLLPRTPWIGIERGGAPRWIGWGPVTFQPSELAKFALVLLLAARLTQYQEKIKSIFTGFLLPIGITLVFVALVVQQKDVGIPMVMIATAFIMMWVAGVRKVYIVGCTLIPIGGLVPLIMFSGYRMSRIRAFLDPWSDRANTGYQLIQSMSAFAQGGFWGRGAGAGEQKLGYLPAAHTDFIYAVVGEELGFAGTALTLLLFAALVYAALRIAANAPDLYGTLLATGIVSLIVVQALFIMAVTLGLLPTKGLPLPFVSYGGSALIVSLTMVGVVVNIGVQSHERQPQRAAKGRKPSSRKAKNRPAAAQPTAAGVARVRAG